MAVYTEVTDEALAAFLADYDIGSMVAFRGIAEGVEETANYSLRTTIGRLHFDPCTKSVWIRRSCPGSLA